MGVNETPALGLRAIVGLIAISVPLFLVLETLVRVYVLAPIYGPLFADIAGLYWPEFDLASLPQRATSWVWILVGVTLAAGLVGLLALRWAVTRALNQAERPAPAAVRDQLILLTSIPQVPGLLATLCFALGADLPVVLGCVGLSMAFVICQGFVGERSLERFAP